MYLGRLGVTLATELTNMGQVLEPASGAAAPSSTIYKITHNGQERESSSEPTGSYLEEATKVVKIENGVETVIKSTDE